MRGASALVFERPSALEHVNEALAAVAADWAREVAPGAAYFAHAGEPAPPVDGVTTFPQARGDRGDRLLAATAHVFAERSEPLLVVGTRAPVLARAHAREAEAVLRGGADVVLGPSLGGAWWLLGLWRPQPDLLDLGADWEGASVLARLTERADALGLRLELLGTQRELDGPADARALAGDPRLPDSVAAALSARSGGAASRRCRPGL